MDTPGIEPGTYPEKQGRPSTELSIHCGNDGIWTHEAYACDLESHPVDQTWVRYQMLTMKRDTFPPFCPKDKVPAVGLEPTTTRLKVLRSTNWAKRA